MPNTSSDIVKIALLSVIPYFFIFFALTQSRWRRAGLDIIWVKVFVGLKQPKER